MSRLTCFSTLVWLIAVTASVETRAQNAPSDQAAESVAVIGSQLSPAQIELRKKEIEDDADLDASLKAQLLDLYDQSVLQLRSATASAKAIEQLRSDQESAPSQLQRVQQKLSQPMAPVRIESTNGASAQQIQAELAIAETALQEARTRLDQLEEEATKRGMRRIQIPALLTTARRQLEETDKALEVKAPDAEPSVLTRARETLLKSRRLAIQRSIDLFEAELPAYEATGTLLTARRDLAAREVTEGERYAKALRDRLADTRRRDAERQALEAQRAAATAHPAVREMARRNSELAERNTLLVQKLARIIQDVQDVRQLTETLETEFEELQQRAEAAQFSHAIGVLLRNQRNNLPDVEEYLRRAEARQPEVSELNLQIIEYENERRRLVDPAPLANRTLQALGQSISPDDRAEIEAEVLTYLNSRREILAALLQNANNYLNRLVELDTGETELIEQSTQQSDYIAEHVLWVRNTTALEPARLIDLLQSFSRMTAGDQWWATCQILLEDIQNNRIVYLLAVCCIGGLFVWRFQLKKQLRDGGRLVSKPSATELRPTLVSLAISVMLAILFPGILWWLGGRLMAAAEANTFGRAVGLSMQSNSLMLLTLELFRQICCPHGLAESHFGWPVNTVNAVRGTLRWMMGIGLPLEFLVQLTESGGSEIDQNSLGRVAFVLLGTLLALALFYLVRPGSDIMQDLRAVDEDSLVVRTRILWYPALIGAPLVLAAISAFGFYYTALQLASRLSVTIWLVLALVVARSVLGRWLLVNYRALAIKQARERRAALLQEAAEDEDNPYNDVPEPEVVPVIRLADINVQTRKLIRMGTGLALVFGLWGIWNDVLPALGILRRVTLWPTSVASSGLTETIAGEIPMVTLADLALALMVLLLTIAASRNLPGVLEIAVLRQLPMDAGARYAASTMTRYAITAIGVVLAFQLIGVGWSSVQWLVAAMTVGLGFGLQEIFANFVSGMILLFERPIRVGDTVTVNDITGTVSRIRIRATTILDWSNKELIVPNREFVTGNLMNWTLTNTNLRVIMGVGIAYGSDTELATRLLYEIAESNENVLEDPEPVVVFTRFGDSTLDFELRCFVPSLSLYRTIAHELNTAIDKAFRKARIEIAFPQRDLHVRSIPPSMGQRSSAETPTIADGNGQTFD